MLSLGWASGVSGPCAEAFILALCLYFPFSLTGHNMIRCRLLDYYLDRHAVIRFLVPSWRMRFFIIKGCVHLSGDLIILVHLPGLISALPTPSSAQLIKSMYVGW